jgi:hypothetical protein
MPHAEQRAALVPMDMVKTATVMPLEFDIEHRQVERGVERAQRRCGRPHLGRHSGNVADHFGGGRCE